MQSDQGLADSRITSFGRLVEAYEVLSHRLSREMEEATGLPLLWYGVLLHVGRSPSGQRVISDLVNATAFTSGGVTRLVDRIEQAGYVERRPCPSDRRVTYVALTPAGRRILDEATAVHVRGIQHHMVDVLGIDNMAQLDGLLEMLRGAADAPATPPAVPSAKL